MHNRGVALSDLLPPELPPDPGPGTRPGASTGSRHRSRVPAPRTRRQARARRRRRGRTPLLAGLALVVAAGSGSVAALIADPPQRPVEGDLAAFPESDTTAESAQPTDAPVAQAQAGGEQDVEQDTGQSGGESSTEPTNEESGDRAEEPVNGQQATGPRRIADVSGRPERTSGTWPALTYTLRASTTPEEPLQFPGAIIGFTLVDSAASMVRVTEGRYFAAVGGLPVRTASYDECRQTRFYVRWMALDPKAVVEATFVDEHVRTVQNRPVHGAAGWQSSYGCVQPALRIKPPAGANPASADVLVETQVWRRR